MFEKSEIGAQTASPPQGCRIDYQRLTELLSLKVYRHVGRAFAASPGLPGPAPPRPAGKLPAVQALSLVRPETFFSKSGALRRGPKLVTPAN
eukprot:768106-Hanusia_phi.AAC.3